jgi:adhesin/invasin
MTMMRHASLLPRLASATLAMFALAACNGDDGPKPPAAVSTVSQAAISGIVGDLVPEPLTVKITDAGGSPVGGVVVTFAVVDGGGSVTPTADTTDNTGLATTRWRLGGTAGQQRVTATVAGVTSPATFTATAAAGVPATVAISAGDNQSAVNGAAVATPPAVVVRDRFNNLVPGTSVFFSVAAGGGSVQGAGATTNASGVATVGEWRLGTSAGANRLTALVLSNGVANNPITFNATATAGTAAGMAAQSPTTFTSAAGAQVSPVPSVRVVDASGNPVAGVSVTFIGSNGSTVTGSTKTTNANGVVAPDSWQLGTVAQNYTLTATSTGLSSVVFTATAAPAGASQVSAFAGNNQSATVGRTLPIDPAVRVTDGFGNPIAGVEVNFDVQSGGGSAVSRRQFTDANGVASVGGWTIGDAPGPNTLRAVVTGANIIGNPVIFTATAVAGAPTSLSINGGTGQTATAGSILPVAPTVIVRDSRGNPVSGVTVSFTPAVGSGSVSIPSPVTNASGIASAGLWTLGVSSGVQTLTASVAGLPSVTFTATASAGTAARAVAVSDSVLGSFPVTSFVSPLPSVRVVDANGNPVAGAEVVFTLDPIGGSGTALTGATKTTGADGIATLTTWKIGTLVGTYRVRALITNVNQNGLEPTFYVVGTAGPAAAVAVAPTSLASQPAVANTAVSILPAVRVVDQYGNGVAGATVTFAAGAGTQTVGVPTVVVTDVNGYAAVGSWTMGAGSGARTLIATVTGTGITGNPVTFTATVP